MKFLTLTALILTSNFVMASSFDLICSGRKCSTSPYPGAGGCSSSFFRADLDKNSAKFSLPGDFHNIELGHVERDPQSGVVEISGITTEGENVDLSLSILGSRGPALKGKIGTQRINVKCNRNILVNL